MSKLVSLSLALVLGASASMADGTLKPSEIILAAGQPGSCTAGGVTLGENESRTFYSKPGVPLGERCAFFAEERSCQGGALTGDSAYSNPSCQETILDLNATLHPTEETKIIGVFQDTQFKTGTDWILSYRLEGGKLKASYEPMDQKERSRRSVSLAVPVRIANWRTDPTLASADATLKTTDNSFTLSVAGPSTGKTAYEFSTDGTDTYMRARSIEEMTQAYGGAFFPGKHDRKKNDKGVWRNAKAIMLLAPSFGEEVNLSDLSALNFRLDAELKSYKEIGGCVSGKPPAGAQRCYDPKSMGASFRIDFGHLRWSDRRCANKVPGDAVCQYEGDWIYNTLTLFDPRYDFKPGVIMDKPTGSYINKLDPRDFLSGNPKSNPFKVENNRVVAEGDLLQIFKRALLKAAAAGQVPPKLRVGDRMETDAEYLAHYSVASINIGYEVTNLSDIQYEVHDFTMTATHSGAVQHPSCEISVTPPIINKGESAELQWKTALADQFSIDDDVGTRTEPSGSMTITPKESVGFTGTVVGKGGQNDCEAVVIVRK